MVLTSSLILSDSNKASMATLQLSKLRLCRFDSLIITLWNSRLENTSSNVKPLSSPAASIRAHKVKSPTHYMIADNTP